MSDTASRLTAALADHYTIDRELGQGGMATVYLAHDIKHGRDVAIKVMRPEVSAAVAIDRFLLEIQTTARLQHPHIVPVFDSGSADGQHYFVMPVVEGESLRARMDREGPLAVDECVRLIVEVAGALDYAHGQGILHRDLKPENILLSRGHALLADFGIARGVGKPEVERLTQMGMSLGTPAYMSPEQATGDRELTAASDEYGLASILFELLTGDVPFAGATYEAILVKRFTQDAPRTRARRPEASPACDAAIAKALARDPAHRFGSVRDFAAALDVRGAAATSTRGTSIAVLPFANLSTDAENGYFADGLTEEVILMLSKVRALRVVSRTTVMQYRDHAGSLGDIARELGVTHLLEGSVRKGGSRLRVTASLVEAERDTPLWSERFDGTLDDVFDMQDRTAAAVVAALELTLSSEEQVRLHERPIENPDAYDPYLKAREGINAFTATGLRRALSHLDDAMELEPRNVFLIRGKGLAYWSAVNLGLSTDRSLLDRALECADQIAKLAPDSPYIAEIRGLVAAVSGDLIEGVAQCGIAFEAMPEDLEIGFWYGALLIYAGRVDEGLALVRDIQRREPMHPPAALMVIVGEQMRGHPERVIAAFDDGPGPAPPAYWYLVHGMLNLAAGNRGQALAVLDAAPGDDPDLLTTMREFVRRAIRSDPTARTVLTPDFEAGAWQDGSYAEIVAEGFAMLEDVDQAAKWLGRAVDTGFSCHEGLTVHNATWRPWLDHPQLAPVFERLRMQAERQAKLPLGPNLRALVEGQQEPQPHHGPAPLRRRMSAV